MSEIELPAPMYHDDGEEGWHYYTAEQVSAAILAERERCLAAVAALATESRDREERDIIAKCWHAINRAAAIRRGSV